MDFYERTGNYLMDLPGLAEWPEMKTVLEKTIARKPRDWRLPLLAGEAVGRSEDRLIPAAAAIACMQISIILIDDMLDADPRGHYHQSGMPATANLAAGFQALGIESIRCGSAEPGICLNVTQQLNRMMMETSIGQFMDNQNPSNENEYWRLVRAKSSPFFGTAFQIGALFAGASKTTAYKLESFGHRYGELVQLHDDLNDTMSTPANPDWILGRNPLPILFAQVVNHPDRERFFKLRQTISDPEALAEAQTILIRCGAVSYTLDQLINRHQEAGKILKTTPLAHREGLANLLEDVIRPVREIFIEPGLLPVK